MPSSTAADLNNIPLFKPTPLPTIIAVGVARPRAHGHAITSTAIAAVNEKTNVACSRKYHVTKVITPIVTTVGTK